jgi:rhomboid family GlyGly-CTERM serine protease
MSAVDTTIKNSAITTSSRPLSAVLIWLAVLGLANASLLWSGVPATALMFDATAVASGQWWRLLTWPWVHVSGYHLLIDGLTFVLLYQGLHTRRLTCLLWTAIGSLVVPLLFSTDIYTYGLCGLSGVAHGLMAVSCLELMQSRDSRVVGGVFLAVLVAKTVWEVATGSVVFHSLHLGDIGHPVVTTHLGGLLGGVAAFVVISVTQKHRRES